MKKFLAYTLATIIGVIVVNIFFLLIAIGIIGAIASMGEQAVVVKENSVLEITLKNEIQDKASPSLVDYLFSDFKNKKLLGLNNILKNIQKAKKDDKIKGIYLNLSDIQSNFGALATIDEIRNALFEFKKSGKFIYSYANMGYSQKSYYLATVSDSIFVNPETPLGLIGMGSHMVFYKNMLDKMGIQCEVVKVGKYKSAVEPFTQTEISSENREQIEVYIGSLWKNILNGISESRNISVANLNKLADEFNLRMSEEEKKLGLFDEVIYEDQVIDLLKSRCGLKNDDSLSSISIEDYQNAITTAVYEHTTDKIAVIYASGSIGMATDATTIGPELAATIREARNDKQVKAIVLRVNSPGGSALTSDIIWREVQLAANEKPLVASMGNVAASGGYYIACAAQTIVASPTTITGSIGVFGQFFTGEKLLNEKIGLTGSSIKTNKQGDFGGYYNLPLPIGSRPLNTYEKNVLQRYVEHTYETFLNRVAEGRNMATEQVHEVAQGRVWTGEDAQKIGLVDTLGGLEDAIKIAAEKAGIDAYKVVEYPKDKSLLEELLGDLSTTAKTAMLKQELGAFYETFRFLKEATNTQEGIIARVPYELYLD